MSSQRDDSIAALYAQMQRLARLYQFRDANNACVYDLRVNECYLLQLVVEQGPLSVNDLSARLGIHKSNASRIARALAARGLVVEKPDPGDRRSILWHPTVSGRKKSDLIKTHLTARYARALADLDTAAVNVLIEGLEKLTDDTERRLVKPDR